MHLLRSFLAASVLTAAVVAQPGGCQYDLPLRGPGTFPRGANCAGVPPRPAPGGPPPPAIPRSAGPCGSNNCFNNSRWITWYSGPDNKIRMPATANNSCLAFDCQKNYSAENHPHDMDESYPTGGSNPTPFGVVCTSTVDDLRVFITNALPALYAYLIGPGFRPCSAPLYVSVPLNPVIVNDVDGAYEIPLRGIVGMALNGVPIFGAQDAGGTDAVALGISPWVGHSTPDGHWHYHDSAFPVDKHTTTPENAGESDLVGYALDGFPIYGPLDEDSDIEYEDSSIELDVCNGRYVEGHYQYHMKRVSEINTTSPYCVDWENSVVNQWNYVLGCYSGDPTSARARNYNEVVPLPHHYKCKVYNGKVSDLRDLIGGQFG